MTVQLGGRPNYFKPIPSVGAGAYEIRVREAAVQTDSRSAAMKSTVCKTRRKTDARLVDTRAIPASGYVCVMQQL
jgi:hypothetical protein